MIFVPKLTRPDLPCPNQMGHQQINKLALLLNMIGTVQPQYRPDPSTPHDDTAR